MRVKEYLEKLNTVANVTFIKAKAVMDEHTPFYHDEYVTTPILSAYEWYKNETVGDYIILNDHQPPIDWLSGAAWRTKFRAEYLECLLVISEEDLHKLYSPSQAESLEKYIESQIKERNCSWVAEV